MDATEGYGCQDGISDGNRECRLSGNLCESEEARLSGLRACGTVPARRV